MRVTVQVLWFVLAESALGCCSGRFRIIDSVDVKQGGTLPLRVLDFSYFYFWECVVR
jgi:hypothetical protein